VPDASHVLEMEDLPIRKDLTVDVQPVAIEDHQRKQLKGRTISLVKVVWNRRTGDSTWELEEDIRQSYPHLFSGKSIFEVKIF